MLLPESASTYAPDIDRIFWAIVGITGFFFFLVQGALLLFVLLYRAKPGKPAHYIHGNNLVEIVWTVIPALILLGLTIASQKVWAEIRFPKNVPSTSIQAEILAEQFAWNIRYPGADGVFQTTDDVVTLNQLHLPVGVPVLLHVKSKDVIHSFFVPEFRVKQDAVPGLPTSIWVEATKAGQYDIKCAELCGLGHYRMKGYVTTEPLVDFQKWLMETKANE
ncbi:MAG: cytochrome c oxidase subunit II [Candidatus Omnitrophica bacterium]|nr:cytochrome c oxidase subunit II [Candidatus Omnitrophota bacterium]